MKNMKLATIILLVLSLFTSCSEDSGSDAISMLPETKQSFLVGKTWKLSGLTVEPARARVAGGPLLTNWYADMETCEQDAQKIYFFNGDLVFDEGPTRCEDSDIQTFTGSWTFNSDETIITELQRNFINIIYSFTIIELTSDLFIIEREQDYFGTVYTFRETYELN